MRARSLLAAVAIFAAVTAGATSWETSSYRTRSGDLVQAGMIMAEVLAKAGEPWDRRVITEGVTAGGQLIVTREVWTYRGYDGIYSLTFSGNRLERIEVVPNR